MFLRYEINKNFPYSEIPFFCYPKSLPKGYHIHSSTGKINPAVFAARVYNLLSGYPWPFMLSAQVQSQPVPAASHWPALQFPAQDRAYQKRAHLWDTHPPQLQRPLLSGSPHTAASPHKIGRKSSHDAQSYLFCKKGSGSQWHGFLFLFVWKYAVISVRNQPMGNSFYIFLPIRYNDLILPRQSSIKEALP